MTARFITQLEADNILMNSDFPIGQSFFMGGAGPRFPCILHGEKHIVYIETEEDYSSEEYKTVLQEQEKQAKEYLEILR